MAWPGDDGGGGKMPTVGIPNSTSTSTMTSTQKPTVLDSLTKEELIAILEQLIKDKEEGGKAKTETKTETKFEGKGDENGKQ